MKVEMFFYLMINMKIIFNFITMMLINHISNMHSNIYFKNYYYYLKNWLSKLVQVGESRWIIEYFSLSHDVALKCICNFSIFKYYNRIHQTYNGKVSLKLNLTSHFHTYLLSIFIVSKFLKFCNHNYKLKERHHAFIMLFSIIFNILSSILSKIGPFFYCFGDNYVFCLLYHAFTLW